MSEFPISHVGSPDGMCLGFEILKWDKPSYRNKNLGFCFQEWDDQTIAEEKQSYFFEKPLDEGHPVLLRMASTAVEKCLFSFKVIF